MPKPCYQLARACLVTVLLTAFGEHRSDTPVADDLKILMNGRWKPASFFSSGAALNIDRVGGTLRFSKDQYELQLDDTIHVYKYKLYPNRRPKEFEAWYLGERNAKREPGAKPDVHGIYEIEGERLRRCYVRYRKPLPTGFDITSTVEEQSTSTVHTRVDD